MPMNGAGAERLESLKMGGGAVTFVGRKTIAGVNWIKTAHMMIAGNFGDNGSRGDRKTFGIGFDDRTMGNILGQRKRTVEKNKIEFVRKSRDNFFDS